MKYQDSDKLAEIFGAIASIVVILFIFSLPISYLFYLLYMW